MVSILQIPSDTGLELLVTCLACDEPPVREMSFILKCPEFDFRKHDIPHRFPLLEAIRGWRKRYELTTPLSVIDKRHSYLAATRLKAGRILATTLTGGHAALPPGVPSYPTGECAKQHQFAVRASFRSRV